MIKTVANQIVSGNGIDDVEELANYLGLQRDKVDIETLMHLMQIQKAIKNKDTNAYEAVMDRINVKSQQSINQNITKKSNSNF